MKGKSMWLASLLLLVATSSFGRDLDEIKQAGVLRHIGVSYANFISYVEEERDHTLKGLDVELIQGFAEYLGVKYQFVPKQTHTLYDNLIGRKLRYVDGRVEYGETLPIEGDLIAAGVTILDWRKEVVSFSTPYFPSAVWLMSRSDHSLKPIKPSGNLAKDIKKVKSMIDGHRVLVKAQSCLDPSLYRLEQTGAELVMSPDERKLNEMVPAILNNDAQSTLIDVPDALVALDKWAGEIKVIGPISEHQRMGVAFPKESVELRQAFNCYLKEMRADGRFNQLVEKYYPTVFHFYRDFF